MSRELPFHPSDDDRIAAEMARELEALTMTTPARPSAGFADRVMLAVADEPLPQPVRAFGLALLGGRLRAAAAAIGDAWRIVSSRPAPMFVRAQALALVLVVVVSSLALAGGATVGALGLLSNTPQVPGPSGPPPTLVVPTPARSPEPDESPSESPDASDGTEPTETPEPSETSEPQETEHATNRPRTSTPEPTAQETDDHSGDSGPGGGGGDTPQPTETGHPSGSDG